MLAITARALYTPVEKIEQPLVLIEDGLILSVVPRSNGAVPHAARQMDFPDDVLVPGLVDIHIHGGMGYDVMHDDEAARHGFERFLVNHGVTSYFPTTVTAAVEDILRALERWANMIEAAHRGEPDRTAHAQPLGIHLEGPFLSHARRGVHPPEKLLTPDVRTFQGFWQASRGHLRLMTLAPELKNACEVIAEASRLGVCVSLGHSDATQAETRCGIAAGACHATHTFNAMRPLNHRAPGVLGEILSNPSLTADIIADGIHVDPSVVRLFLQTKGVDHAVLITDATAATGMPDGRYRLGSLEVDVHDGKCLHEGKLAGSVLTLDRALRNVVSFAEWKLGQAVRLATLNPARVAGASGKGILQASADADLVVLTNSGDVRATILKGVVAEG
jgi:N-acetylglucosamine-6-phosphate deacetylase